MSSWKKAAKCGSRSYLERHQPEVRKHLGVLEKKKDYRLRSRAFHVKENKLKKLRKKALNKNPDEFCFHMINSEVKDGFHYEKEKKEEHTEAQLKLMETQDASYINYKLSTELKKIDKLKKTLAILGIEDKPKSVHTFYVDSKSEVKNFDPAKKLNTDPALLDKPYYRPTVDALKRLDLGVVLDDETLKKTENYIKQQQNELRKRMQRAQELTVTRQKLEVKKKLLNKKGLAPVLLKEGTKTSAPVYKWKKERKR